MPVLMDQCNPGIRKTSKDSRITSSISIEHFCNVVEPPGCFNISNLLMARAALHDVISINLKFKFQNYHRDQEEKLSCPPY